MRKLIVAETAGFCFGVRKAVDTVYAEIGRNDGEVYTYGPIIHNEEVIRDLEEKGVRVLHSEEELQNLKQGTVIIRSHGVGKRIYDICKANHIRMVDATCPFVKKIHRIVAEQCAAGKTVFIVGNPHHPEVEGIRGWASADTRVIESAEEFAAAQPAPGKKICIVSQTTYNLLKFEEIVDKINKLGYDIECFNTICNATQERQTEAKRIAARVDAMIVIGGKSSSNTAKLAEICGKECRNTLYIQTLDDLDPQVLQSAKSIGITAGASTPNHIIEEVRTNVGSKF